MEAYLFGSLLLRDFQDQNRMGPPKVQPILPRPFDEGVVKCKSCNRGCDYENIREVSMGLIKCPHCNAKIDQEGNVCQLHLP